MRERTRRRTGGRPRRVVMGAMAGAVVVALVGGGVALAAGRAGGPAYRTAVAGLGSVEQVVEAVGAVASVTRSDVAFQVGGTVSDVSVAVGDVVSAGDLLATLDAGPLEKALAQAEADLADAERRLDEDLASQTATTSVSTAAPAASSDSSANPVNQSSTPPAGDTSSPGDTASAAPPDGSSDVGTAPTLNQAVLEAVTAVQAAQLALLDQQETTRAALGETETSLAASRSTCQVVLDASIEEPVTSEEPAPPEEEVPGSGLELVGPAGESVSATVTSVGSDATLAADLTACQAAIEQVLTDQDEVSWAQSVLVDLATSLDEAVTALRAAVVEATATTDPPATDPPATDPAPTDPAPTEPQTPATTTPAEPSAVADAAGPVSGVDSATQTGGSGIGAAVTVATADDLLADQAAVDLAGAQVALARAALEMVELTAPIAGTVAAVSLAVDATVSVGSADARVTILGDGGHVVTTTLPVSVIDVVGVGQAAEVTVPTTDQQLSGVVSSIGLLNVSTGTTPSYAVTIALDPTDAVLFDDASAQVTIAVGAAEDSLTIPTSAVHLEGSAVTVDVLRGGAVETVEVERGASGSELTEILTGLAEGDEVVLADLRLPLDTGSQEESSGLAGLGTEVEIPRGRQGPTGGWPGGGG